MMLTRRHLLVGLGAMLLPSSSVLRGRGAWPAAALVGCERRPSSSAKAWPRTTTLEGVEMIELFPNGADEGSPLVVAIHGMGDRPDRWVDEWRTFPAKVHIALPRAFDRYGDGYAWFPLRESMTDAELGAVVGDAEARLWRGIAALAGKRRVIVTGFSQGGILSFAMAARHPDALVRAFPVAGSCPGPILPQNKARAAPISAFHGTRDPVLDVKWGREAVHAFKEQGNEATLQEYEGVGHTITRKIHDDLWAAIAKTLATPS